jgi:ferric-dicitrate binding protein FerR (iron transport regulator)
VRVADSTVASRRFSGRFSRGSLEEAVRLVASVTDVSARRSGAGWILK